MTESMKSNNIKIIDFSYAHKLDPDEKIKVNLNAPEYASPEVIRQDPLGFYTDMWAIGVLTYQL